MLTAITLFECCEHSFILKNDAFQWSLTCFDPSDWLKKVNLRKMTQINVFSDPIWTLCFQWPHLNSKCMVSSWESTWVQYCCYFQTRLLLFFPAATPFKWLSIVLFPESTATPTMARQTRATSRSSAGSEGKSAAVAQPDKRLVSIYMITELC